MSLFAPSKSSRRGENTAHPKKSPQFDTPLTAAELERIFQGCADFSRRPINPGGRRGEVLSLCWLDGLVDGRAVGESVLRPLTDKFRVEGGNAAVLIEKIFRGAVYSSSARIISSTDEAVNALTGGFCTLVFDAANRALVFETRSGEHRSISEPTTEKSVKGAKDSFIETLRVNTALVRRKLRSPDLKIAETTVGRRTRTQVAVLYLGGVANTELVREVRRRIDAIDVDGLLASGGIEEYITDEPRSPFPQLLHTERPDKFASALIDGRVGILVDGIPLGFILPGTFAQLMRAPEDNSMHFIVASITVLLRYSALALSVALPALYVAIAMYHQEMIPTKLLLSIIEAKQLVPFSTAAEVLGMLVAFELLQEAGFRIPSSVGQTMSIIGALIVGQSAVEAKVISPIAVIVVALAGITGYTIPNQDLGNALRLARFIFVLAAIAGGIFGLMCAGVLLVYHLCSLESFGQGYMTPLTDSGRLGLIRSVLRLPLRAQKNREAQLHTLDKRRQK